MQLEIQRYSGSKLLNIIPTWWHHLTGDISSRAQNARQNERKWYVSHLNGLPREELGLRPVSLLTDSKQKELGKEMELVVRLDDTNDHYDRFMKQKPAHSILIWALDDITLRVVNICETTFEMIKKLRDRYHGRTLST